MANYLSYLLFWRSKKSSALWPVWAPSMTWHVVYGYSSNSHSPSPPSSSNAFSLVSSEQDNPSTSGCRFVSHTLSFIVGFARRVPLPVDPLITQSPHTPIASPSCSAVHTGKLRFPEWALVRPCHSIDVSVSCMPSAAANNQPKRRHRRSSSRPWRSWRCTCRLKRGARASPAPSTRSSMRCGASNRWKVRPVTVATFFIFVF